MTITDPAPLICPSCHNSNTSIGASGNAICRDCAHLWNPDDPTIPETPTLAPYAMASPEEVFGAASAGEITPVEALDALMVGGGAVLEGGQVATVVSYTDSDSIIVRLETGDLEEVPLADVLRIMPPPDIPAPADIPDAFDAFAPDMQLALTLAKLIIRAGVESVNGTGENITPGLPPVGYLPEDAELHPVVERAAGLAVAMLVDLFSLDVDTILTAVGAVTETPAEGDPQTEDAHDPSTVSSD